MTQVFLLAGTTSFPDPGNWNPVNTVEIIGSGSGGHAGGTGGSTNTGLSFSGAGGGVGFASSSTTTAGAVGGDGLIIVTYLPLAPSGARAMILA
jgi:hypothetical protein